MIRHGSWAVAIAHVYNVWLLPGAYSLGPAGVQYYNHSKPWVSHVSLQGHDVQQLDMAKAVWTQFTPKPIVWDEVKQPIDWVLIGLLSHHWARFEFGD